MKIIIGKDGKSYKKELAENKVAESEPEPELTPAERREQAYNTEPCVALDGSMLTVTEAAQLWQYYAAEGRTDKTDELTALISAAKASIRERWLDKETEVGT